MISIADRLTAALPFFLCEYTYVLLLDSYIAVQPLSISNQEIYCRCTRNMNDIIIRIPGVMVCGLCNQCTYQYLFIVIILIVPL